MRRALTLAICLLSTNVLAQVNCSRSALQSTVNAYIEAQGAGDPELLNLIPQTSFVHNMEPSSVEESILQEALNIDFHRSLLDEYSCQTFTEVVVTDEAHPYVIGTRMRLTAGNVTEFEAVVTDSDDWLFDAQNYLERSAPEDWSLIPIAERSSRATLVAAANAYFDQFLEGPDSVHVPWGSPCNRLEGGIYTGDGSPTDSCEVGVPSDVNIVNRRFVVDEAIGAIVGFVRFGNNGLPDTHLFRVEDDQIRFVHTLTVCFEPNCGFPMPEASQ